MYERIVCKHYSCHGYLALCSCNIQNFDAQDCPIYLLMHHNDYIHCRCNPIRCYLCVVLRLQRYFQSDYPKSCFALTNHPFILPKAFIFAPVIPSLLSLILLICGFCFLIYTPSGPLLMESFNPNSINPSTCHTQSHNALREKYFCCNILQQHSLIVKATTASRLVLYYTQGIIIL